MHHKILSLILTIVFFTSCSPERRLANKYVKQTKPGSILVLTPDFIYKNSYKIPNIKNFGSLPQQEKDSIAFFTSDIIQYCNDSIYISNLITSLSSGLKYFGYSVYFNQTAEQFLATTGIQKSSFIINFAQIQLEEYLDSISDETSYDTASTNTIEIFVTAINLNSWIELTRVNHVKSNPDILFNSQTITDDFNGYFQYYPLTGEFDYEYTIDSLNIDGLYSAASQLGLKHSQWISDYLMNDYVKKNLPPGEIHDKLFSYDFKNRLLKRLKWQPFTPVNE